MSDPPPRRADLTYLRHRRPPATTASDPRHPTGAHPTGAHPTGAGAARLGLTRDSHRASSTPGFAPRRTSTAAATVLTARRPTVLLDRVQSGVGTLGIRAGWDAAGAARLGCAYRLRSGHSTIARSGGVPRADEPLTLGVRDGVPTIHLDLLRCRRLDRLVVFADLPPDLPPSWLGALQISTYGGALVDVPVDRPPTPGVLVLLSIYNVLGELAVRAECDHITGSVREAMEAHGFTGIGRPDGHATPAG